MRSGIEDGDFNCPMEELRFFLHSLSLKYSQGGMKISERKRMIDINFVLTRGDWSSYPYLMMTIYKYSKSGVADEEATGILECNGTFSSLEKLAELWTSRRAGTANLQVFPITILCFKFLEPKSQFRTQ